MHYNTHQATFRGNTAFVARTVQDIIAIVLQVPSVPFWARGESREYETPCLPSICRPGHSLDTSALIKGSLSQGEFESISQCKDDFLTGRIDDELFARVFCAKSEEINQESEELLYWASLAQHHNQNQDYPTRLLDVTSDILVAAYFACKSDDDEDGYIFYGNFAHNNLQRYGEVELAGSFFDIDEIQDPENPGDPFRLGEDTLCLATLPYSNKRMAAQRGALVWSREPQNGYFTQMRQVIIKIPSCAKPAIINNLRCLGYDEESLLGPCS